MGLLFSKSIPIDEHISVRIPTVGEALQNDGEYFHIATLIASTPYDLMVQLDDIGIDFTKITCFEMFCLLLEELKTMDTSLIFEGIDIKNFEVAATEEEGKEGKLFLIDKNNGLTINEATHRKIRKVLCEINQFADNNKRPGNEDARKYMLERARKKQARAARKQGAYQNSQFEDLIVAMVNTGQFPYNYETVQSVSLYQFNLTVNQIVKKENYNHIMAGCYAGTVDIKKIDKNELDWLSSKKIN